MKIIFSLPSICFGDSEKKEKMGDEIIGTDFPSLTKLTIEKTSTKIIKKKELK